MRMTVYIIAAIEIAAFVLLALTGTDGSDPAGNAMASGFVTIGGMAMVLFLIPALILATVGRALWIALLLVLTPPVLIALTHVML